MQDFPQNPIFQILKCIIYHVLTNVKAKLLAWDHNTDSDYRLFMTLIQRIIFIHNEFEQICGGEIQKVDAYFWKQCSKEIGFPIKEDDVKQKGLK